MSQLPYLASPGNISKALDGIKVAATPPKVSQDFVKTKLGITGSSGNQIATFLKRIGFAASDGVPTEIYKAYRGVDGGRALAEAIRTAYAPLYDRNEYVHECDDGKLKDLIVQETGLALNARPVALTFQTLKKLLERADFSERDEMIDHVSDGASGKGANPIGGYGQRFDMTPVAPPVQSKDSLKLNLGYTINLNLPESTDIEVFNAIFKSLKENLLRSEDD